MIEIEKEDHVGGSAMAHMAGILAYLAHPCSLKKKVIAYNKMYGVVENLLTSGF